MTTKFQLTIGYDDAKNEWGVVIAVPEGQHNAFVRPSLKLAMEEAEIRMSMKEEKVEEPEPLSEIVGLNGWRQAGAINGYGG